MLCYSGGLSGLIVSKLARDGGITDDDAAHLEQKIPAYSAEHPRYDSFHRFTTANHEMARPLHTPSPSCPIRSGSKRMNTQLKPTLGTLHLWGIAVGLVISGEYFGWSYGWGVAGTLGFLVTSFMVATMYTCFIFSFTELTTDSHAGGPFAYSRRAFGEKGGLIAGLATLIEFVFAPPAIALAIGAYLNVQFPPSTRNTRRSARTSSSWA
jgi:ethanolamine permease